MRRKVVASILGALLLAGSLAVGRSAAGADLTAITAGTEVADRLIASGELRQAQALLEGLQADLPADAPVEMRIAVSARLGAVLGETGEDERAVALLQEVGSTREGRRPARAGGRSAQRSRQCPAADRYHRGFGILRQGADLAETAGLARLRVRALINIARAETLSGDGEAAAASLREATGLLDAMPPGEQVGLERLAAAGQALELARLNRAHLELANGCRVWPRPPARRPAAGAT